LHEGLCLIERAVDCKAECYAAGGTECSEEIFCNEQSSSWHAGRDGVTDPASVASKRQRRPTQGGRRRSIHSMDATQSDCSADIIL